MAASKGLVTIACALGVLTPLLWFTSLVTPGEEAVKIRNGLVAEVARPADFTWTPASAPPSFKRNTAQPNAGYASTVQSILVATPPADRRGLPLALAFSRHLMTGAKRVGGPIQSSLDETYRRITQKGQGYCADFTRVFSGLAVTAGLPVRTWSISFESFGAGHSFNEIYDEQLGKWVLVDPFHSIYFVDETSREPLSVLELHDRLILSKTAQTAIRPIVPGAMPFASDDLALDYYRRGFKQLALVWGDNIFDYDQAEPVKLAAKVSRHAERAVAIGLDVYPDLMIYPEGRSARDVEALFRLRDRFIIAAILSTLSLVVFGLLMVRTWSRPRGAKNAL
jgi:hypothetical protein